MMHLITFDRYNYIISIEKIQAGGFIKINTQTKGVKKLVRINSFLKGIFNLDIESDLKFASGNWEYRDFKDKEEVSEFWENQDSKNAERF